MLSAGFDEGEKSIYQNDNGGSFKYNKKKQLWERWIRRVS